jgi:hypothetical protein
MCVFVNPQFKLIKMVPAEISFSIFSIRNANSVISKDRGLLVMIWILYYASIAFTMEMNSDDKFNVVMAFKISGSLYSSDLKTLIGVDLSAWTAAFASSLLSDPSIPLGPPR